MIAHLNGKVARSTVAHLVIDIHGVGYIVAVPAAILSKFSVGATCTLLTHHHITDQASDLYGFETEQELVFFKQLISVSGVGPKSALNIFNLGSVGDIASAISRNDLVYLTKVSGIGRKIAERIVVELKDKVWVITNAAKQETQPSDQLGLAIDALIVMGYRENDAREVVRGLPHEENAQELVKKALRSLNRV